MEERRIDAAIAFVLSVLSISLIITSAATDHWVKADVWVPGNTLTTDSVHYGLYGGKVEFRQTTTSVSHDLHMLCVMTASACAVTCKTTPGARRQEVLYLAGGIRPASLACDANAGFNPQLPYLGFLPVISTALYVTVNLFLYLQLFFAVCSALLALVNACANPTKPLLGLQGLAWASCASALMGTVVVMIWGIHYGASSFQNHLAFAYVAAQTSNTYPSLGYSYWHKNLSKVLLHLPRSASDLAAHKTRLSKVNKPPKELHVGKKLVDTVLRKTSRFRVTFLRHAYRCGCAVGGRVFLEQYGAHQYAASPKQKRKVLKKIDYNIHCNANE
ncbi:hypothetical protein EVAR_8616_1 [Eumeta japonica]|uniref:Uncharacterized protein n=1 Tax=Eumeta variegata TaxID=151549 RepID=A0A4C1XJ26_EUMVA|nr:hypothetical protein EVAR_8616_1 [Eumeta japonica]